MTENAAVNSKDSIRVDKVITFPLGIPGFEKYTTYLVYHKEENGFNAYWLESCDDSSVTFTIVDPEQYGLSYQITLTDKELEILQVDSPDQLGIFMMLSKKGLEHRRISELSANIAGPLVINPAKQLGIQKVLERSYVNTTIVEST